jgi:hypothetical protein
MRTPSVLLIKLLIIFGFCAGCGGGGSTTGAPATGSTSTGSTGSTGAPASSGGTTITGVASKGIIKGGTVNIYATPASGDTGGKILLKTTTTDSSGRFSANIGNYSGIVLIEVSGSYTNESNESTVSISDGAPLRAVQVVGSAGQTVSMSVTPLTELATRKALSGPFLSAASINSANALVSNLFQFDIITTAPVEPAVTAISAATQAQRDYTLALAAISGLAVSAGSLNGAMDAFYRDLAATNRLSAASVTAFQQAAGAFLSDGVHNRTGITAASQALSDVGKYTGTFTLATQGSASAPITSIQMTLTLPAGVTIKKDSHGVAMVAISGVANQAAAPGINYIAPDTLKLAVISWPGFGLGQFATVTYTAEPGTIPIDSDFRVTYQKITGFDGSNDFDLTANIVAALN